MLDPTRSAQVVVAALDGADHGIISCDRYSAYKKFVRTRPDFLLSWCWAHQRRDFLTLANAYPDLSSWAMDWVDAIGELYWLNAQRLGVGESHHAWDVRHEALRHAVDDMARHLEAELCNRTLREPAAKVMRSMRTHWSGLLVFVDHPSVPMDNNQAEQKMRPPVVGRKNFYGSGAPWSGQLAATLYSLLMTVRHWKINSRLWLCDYLNACAENGRHPPTDLDPFLPWAMTPTRLKTLRVGINSS